MRIFVILSALLQVVFGGFTVDMPYPNPAGVTYVSNSGRAALTYGANANFPLQYAAPVAVPAKLEAHHVGYAAAQVPAVAAVPFVKHLSTVSHVPVTRYEAHPAVIEKQVDVLKPAVSSRKIEVRRPAIQKQFYDIEERVVIRPAGSALVELDEPTSKAQTGPTVVQPLENPGLPFAQTSYAHANEAGQTSFAPSNIPVVAHAPVHLTVAPVLSHAPIQGAPAPIFISSSTPASATTPTPQVSPANSEDESVVVENANFRSSSTYDARFNPPLQNSENQVSSQQQADENNDEQIQAIQSRFQQAQMRDEIAFRQHQQEQQEQLDNILKNSRSSQSIISEPQVIARSNGVPQDSIGFPSESSTIVPSVRSSPEESLSNQNRLIQLLTARGGVTEIGFERDGSGSQVGDVGNIRARVISATPAPDDAEPAGEHVSTRRVVVSRPIETLQQINVVEPATKYERVAFQHPTYIKTAHLDHVQVHGSVPVVGKAFAPTVAHAAVPVFQKTISPVY